MESSSTSFYNLMQASFSLAINTYTIVNIDINKNSFKGAWSQEALLFISTNL